MILCSLLLFSVSKVAEAGKLKNSKRYVNCPKKYTLKKSGKHYYCLRNKRKTVGRTKTHDKIKCPKKNGVKPTDKFVTFAKGEDTCRYNNETPEKVDKKFITTFGLEGIKGDVKMALDQKRTGSGKKWIDVAYETPKKIKVYKAPGWGKKKKDKKIDLGVATKKLSSHKRKVACKKGFKLRKYNKNQFACRRTIEVGRSKEHKPKCGFPCTWNQIPGRDTCKCPFKKAVKLSVKKHCKGILGTKRKGKVTIEETGAVKDACVEQTQDVYDYRKPKLVKK